jgi:hypothetical protein
MKNNLVLIKQGVLLVYKSEFKDGFALKNDESPELVMW